MLRNSFTVCCHTEQSTWCLLSLHFVVTVTNGKSIKKQHDGTVQNYKGIKSDFGLTYSQAITEQTDARHISRSADPKY
jgi:hypothetical protein